MSELYVVVPRIGTNDDVVTIGSWLVENGSYVQKGQPVASLETTKETEDLVAEQEGYVFYNIEAGTDLRVGERMAVLTDNAHFSFPINENSQQQCRNITDKARELAERYHVDLSLLPQKEMIREKDIMSLVEQPCQEVIRSKANDLIIVTGGGPAQMCIELLLHNKAYNIHGIVDPKKKKGELVNGIPVIGDETVLPELKKEGYLTAIVSKGSIGNDNQSEQFHMRKHLFCKVKSYGFFVPTLIHPTASVATTAQIGEGTLIYEHASVGSEALIGDDCIINTGAVVSHNCKIGSHTRISPGAMLAGNVTVGENALIGMGTTVYMGVKIGANVIIANGKNIFKDVPEGSIVK